MRTIAIALCAAGLAGCMSTRQPMSTSDGGPSRSGISAAAVSTDGATLWYAIGATNCEVRSLSISDRAQSAAFLLDWCPERIEAPADGTLIVSDGRARGVWKRLDGTDVVPGRILAATGVRSFVEARDGRVVWVDGEVRRDLGAEGDVRWPTFLPGSPAVLLIARGHEGERIVKVTADGTSESSPVFTSIDSFAVSPRGDEIVYSARREGGFDVAISSPDGKRVNWIPSDRGDEVGVTWAPRGNKVSYLIHRPDGTLVRSVHVPTSFQLMFETPLETVRLLAWEPRAEKIVMVLEGPDRSPHIDWIEYSGAGRAALLASAISVGREPERVALGDAGAILLPPPVVRYGQKLPLFIVPSEEPLAWDDRVRDLDALGGGILLIPEASLSDGAALSTLLSQLSWTAADEVVVFVDSTDSTPRREFSPAWTLVRVSAQAKSGGTAATRRSEAPIGVVDAMSWEAALDYLRARFFKQAMICRLRGDSRTIPVASRVLEDEDCVAFRTTEVAMGDNRFDAGGFRHRIARRDV